MIQMSSLSATQRQSIWLGLATIIFAIALFSAFNTKTNVVDPSLYLNEELTEAERLKVRIHSQHHSQEDIEKLVNALTSGGMEWADAHALLSRTDAHQHLSHINTQIATVFVASLITTVALLLALIAKSILDEILVSFENKLIRIWFSLLYFVFLLIVLSVVIMFVSHYLSFRTFSEKLLF